VLIIVEVEFKAERGGANTDGERIAAFSGGSQGELKFHLRGQLVSRDRQQQPVIGT